VLVLTRREQEKIVIGGDGGCPLIEIVVVEIDRNKVRIGIAADKSIPIYREEILPAREAKP
jgi:carbon storage regulator